MTSPLIAITTYPPNAMGRFDLPAAYVDSVRRAGGEAVLIPPGSADPEALVSRFDGVILSGGGDIDPAIYGGSGHRTIYGLHPERDEDEIRLARWVVETRFPAFAICRGMQVLNVAFGGTLNAHLPDDVGTAIAHRVEPEVERGMPSPTPHPIAVEPSRLAEVLGARDIAPMSWHHQAVVDVGDGFRVVATAPDGTVEALEHEVHTDLLCVQWHPEVTAGEDPVQQRLFDDFVATARRRRDAARDQPSPASASSRGTP